MQRERKQKGDCPQPLLAAKRFGRYMPENEAWGGQPKVENNKILRLFEEAWDSWDMFRTFPARLTSISQWERWREGEYRNAINYARKLPCRLSDVEAIAFHITARFETGKNDSYFMHKAALFLSALVNAGPEDSYRIPVTQFPYTLNMLGYRNTKVLRICGDAGDDVGWKMKRGSILVEGSAGHRAGREMRGGLLTIAGDAKCGVGSLMRGGEIRVQGTEGVSESKRGGKIYIGGSLAFDKPDLR